MTILIFNMTDLYRYIKDLTKSLDDNDEYVRAASVRSLGELKISIPFDVRTKVIKDVINAGKDKKGIVKHAAATSLGQLKDVIFSEGMMNVATMELLKLSYDREWGIRGAAAISFGELGDRIPANLKTQVLERVLALTKDFD